MQKHVYFRDHWGKYWPDQNELKTFFLTQRGRQNWSYGGNDGWLLECQGVNGSGDLPAYGKTGPTGIGSRIDANFTMDANLDLGVLLGFDRFGGGFNDHYCSTGDLTRLHEWVRTLHGDLRPVGLYIPFDDAWSALKEFMDTGGELPKCIPWIRTSELPSDAFPDRGNISFNGLRAINDKP